MLLRLSGVFRPVSDAHLRTGALLREIETGARDVTDHEELVVVRDAA